jgi:hypothetical protein
LVEKSGMAEGHEQKLFYMSWRQNSLKDEDSGRSWQNNKMMQQEAEMTTSFPFFEK